MALRKDVPSPLAARNDAEGDAKDEDKDKADKDKADKDKADKDKAEKKDDAKKNDTAKKDPPKPLIIDLDGLDARVVALPPKAGNYSHLAAIAGKVLYRRSPRTGTGDDKATLVYYDLEEREEKTVLEGVTAFAADGRRQEAVRLPGQGQEVRLRRRQGGAEAREGAAHRRARDDGRSARRVEPDVRRRVPVRARLLLRSRACTASTGRRCATRYQALLDDAVTRWDVNFVLGEFIGELNASHTYRGGGDVEQAPQRGAGLLGVDWALENGAYRIAHIVRRRPAGTPTSARRCASPAST